MTLNAQLHRNQKVVDEWNASNPVGTPVTARMDSGKLLRTETTSVAWVLGEHSAVAMVRGISGCYPLSRIKPLPKRYGG